MIKDIKIIVYVYVQDWTMPTVKNLLFDLDNNKIINITDLYICADRYDINCINIEGLRQTIEKEIPLREGVVLELDFSNELTSIGNVELEKMIRGHSGYMYFTNDKLVDVPLRLRDKIGVLGINRIYREFIKPYSEVE